VSCNRQVFIIQFALQGFRTGYGTFYYADGSSFVGTFRQDLKDGEGVLYYKDGSRYSFFVQYICMYTVVLGIGFFKIRNKKNDMS
jgi:hypothetical protein